MITSGDIERAQDEGSLAASRALLRLNIEPDHAVDVFSIIEKARIWLIFAPLDDALGAFEAGGILINNRRPRSVQRFTAAHEFGHSVLGHGSSLDGNEIERSPALFRMDRRVRTEDLPYTTPDKMLEEAAANAFAIDFLLAPAFVNRMWRKFQLPEEGDLITVDNVYHLSLFAGVSYTATVRQLSQLKKISTQRAREFLQIAPKQIKVERGQGAGPDEPHADVWALDKTFSGEYLNLGLSDEMHLKLNETPSTGYLWRLNNGEQPRAEDSQSGEFKNNLTLISDNFEVWNAQRVGSGGIRHFMFRGENEGTHRLHLVKCRPWQPGKVVEQFDLEVQVSPTQLEGLRVKQMESILA